MNGTVTRGAGFPKLSLALASWVGVVLAFVCVTPPQDPAMVWSSVGGSVVATLLSIALVIVEPNGIKVLIFLGRYVGTVKESGFHWGNPFLVRGPVSLRMRTLNCERLKVNDLVGNPVEIAAAMVWQIDDPYRTSFDIDDYEMYVMT